MLRLAILMFVLALVAAGFGFGGIAAGAATIGKVLFGVFVILAAIAVIALIAGRRVLT